MSREGGELEELLVGVVVHDLRNPLSAVLTGASLLVNPSELPDGGARIAGRVQAGAERMARMIEQLSDWATWRYGSGLLLLPAPTDPFLIARGLLEELPPAQAARVVLEQGQELRGRWDARRLTQVLTTLVANALDHGAPDGAVRLRIFGDEKTVRFAVHNSGPPIAAELLPLLFEPLARRRAQRPVKARGLGFGLSLARAIASAHGGALDVESTGAGTTFTLTLPRVQP
jgi:phosphoserine phosphatase RsbU/P